MNLESKVNLFGVGACLNADQVEVLSDISIDTTEIHPNDSCKDQNSCGVPIENLLELYPFYNTQKGLYKSWGDIEFPWEIDNLTPNLLISKTDDRWKVSKYHAVNSYFTGNRVLLIEDDGFRLCVYEALENIVAISGPFDRSKWNQVCCVKTTIPVGLPTIEELRERYKLFNLNFFLEQWQEFDSEWQAPLYERVVQDCYDNNTTIEDVEKCIKTTSKTLSDDRWEKAKVRKEYFYRVGDYVLIDAECGDNLCLYICVNDIPATEENYELHKNFSPVVNSTRYWDRVYCVMTGRNKCLEPQRNRDLPNYQLVQIGSEGHYIEQPLPYYPLSGNKLCEEFTTLNDYVEIIPPKVLTQEEIDALE